MLFSRLFWTIFQETKRFCFFTSIKEDRQQRESEGGQTVSERGTEGEIERERENRERKQTGGGSKRQHKTEKRARDRLMDEFEGEAVMVFFHGLADS